MSLIKVPAGKYIVAVSGGVDSMALLDMLRRQPEIELIVAHVNHGIRPDAAEDEKLVRSFAMSHNIEYETTTLQLGAQASEAAARKARYDFLRYCRTIHNAMAIVTAHHEDDLLETAVINLLRGTSWRGLAPFTHADVLRPLLGWTKQALRDYATQHHVPWRDDSTNDQPIYLRNRVRSRLADKSVGQNHYELLRRVRNQTKLRQLIETLTTAWLDNRLEQGQNGEFRLDRLELTMLPRDVGYELVQAICRRSLGHSLVQSLASRLLIFAKVAKVGHLMPLSKTWRARAERRTLIVEPVPAVVSLKSEYTSGRKQPT